MTDTIRDIELHLVLILKFNQLINQSINQSSLVMFDDTISTHITVIH